MVDQMPVIVLTTIGSVHDAGKIAHELVDQRLAACVNIVDQVRSLFRWEGTVSEEGEKLLVIKTLPERLDALRTRLFEIHPYEVPEFLVIGAEGVSDAYGRWLRESCRTDRARGDDVG
ncbi:MAG TPA: divalent-cation tolerance protein CutA, partial [Thermoanaerobaculia bacterium]|nr:divalent-cation tolerance protein CutA [Thermoanaerobaculia bacterium]